MTTLRQRLIITGFMCAGKTTVARALAARLNCAWLDLDDLIVARAGRSVPAIIDEDGEARFRELETEALRSALSESDARIIALGGGAWAFEQNRTLIAERDGFTVWLDAPFELCWQRIRSEGDARPLARDREKAARLYGARRALYELADLRVQVTEERSTEDVAAEIEHALLHRRTKM